MLGTWTRRDFFVAAGGALAAACVPSRATNDASASSPGANGAGGEEALAAIEARVGGRMGVFALDTGNGRVVAHRPDERFAMCSTFKWVLAAAILARVDRGELILDDAVKFGESDLLEYAPVTRAHVADGVMTVEELARASVTVSDNTAANLLLAKLGGPAALTRFARGLGDEVTRLDRNEPDLNANEPGDARDTTSPRAMVTLMRRVLVGDALSAASRERLVAWMRACETGKKRLRAGCPERWLVGDKTGSGARAAVNDVAIAVPPDRAPILIASYMSEGHGNAESLGAAHAEVARAIVRELA